MKTNVFKIIKPFIAKHEPEILMAMGVSGLIFSTVWGIKATVKATRKVDNKKKELGKDKLTIGELFTETWKLYLPVAISVVVSVPCIVAGNRVASKKNMALAAAFTLSETALQEYQDKTREIVGEKKEQEIHESVSKDIVEKTYGKSQILLSGDGESLFMEPISGRYFKSNWNKILRSANELNAKAVSSLGDYITLTEWFNELGLDGTTMSDSMGWTISDGVAGLIDISIDSVMTPDNTPCGSIYYTNRPIMFK